MRKSSSMVSCRLAMLHACSSEAAWRQAWVETKMRSAAPESGLAGAPANNPRQVLDSLDTLAYLRRPRVSRRDAVLRLKNEP